MKIAIWALALILSTVPNAFSEPGWTHSAWEGEDASSASYYFYKSDGEAIVYVRSVWNGGAQNPPEVTDYILEGGNIVVRHSKGKRSAVEDLITGREAKLELLKEYVIKSEHSEAMLLGPAPDKNLTASQLLDLSNLIRLLAMERKVIEK